MLIFLKNEDSENVVEINSLDIKMIKYGSFLTVIGLVLYSYFYFIDALTYDILSFISGISVFMIIKENT